MNHHRRDTIVMSPRNVLDPIYIGHKAGAFIVNDNIEAFGPIRFFVNAELRVPGITGPFVNDGPRNIRAGADAFRENLLLRFIVMATTASDHERMKRLGGSCKTAEDAKCQRENSDSPISMFNVQCFLRDWFATRRTT